MPDRRDYSGVEVPAHDEPEIDVPTGFYDEDDAPLRITDYGPEDYLAFVIFWVLSAIVFTQFFSRYVLNSSVAWTEEVARYLLIGVCFVGSVIAVRKNTHIMVEFFYRYVPKRAARVLTTLVDLIRIAFFAYGIWLAWLVLNLVKNQRMTALPISKGWIYGVVVAGFVGMTIRSIQVAVRHWRQGYSDLDRDVIHVRTD